MDEVRLVRLRPVDRRRGHVMRRYTFRGMTFEAGRGWSRVDRGVADHLAGVRQKHNDDVSPLAFEVVTQAEARLLDEAEAREKGARRAADDPPLLVARPPTPAATEGAEPEERGRRTKKDKE